MSADERAKIDEVIEAHRVKIGADKVHISLAPGATAEHVQKFFDDMTVLKDRYNSFSPLEQEKAKVARLRALLSRICKLGKRRLDDNLSQDTIDLKHQIFSLTDMIADVDMDKEIEWMELNRKSSKEAYLRRYEIFNGK